MRDLLKPNKTLLGGRELRFLSIFSPFLIVIALAVAAFVYLIEVLSLSQLLPLAGMLSGTILLTGIISWNFATTLYAKEKDLRENRMLRESFMEKTQSGLFVKDLTGKFLYSNDVWSRMLGSSNNEVEGKTDYDFFPRKQADLLKHQDQLVLTNGDRIEFDDILTAADGNSKFVLMKFAMRTLSGRVYGIGAIAHDVTKVLQTEKALEESEHRFETLLDMAPNAIIIADAAGKIKLVNRQAAKLFGRPIESLANMSVDDLVPVEDRAKNQKRREDFLKSPMIREMGTEDDLYGERGNGDKFPIDIALSPVTVGDETMIMSIIRDITKHKEALLGLQQSTEKLRELNDELERERKNLEKRVHQRTRELERASQRAEDANKAKSMFLATMSHEIRTPMNGVIGTIDVLRQSSLRPKQVEHVEIIKDSAYSLLTVIDDILDFSKIEAGKIELEQEPVILSYLVESACSALMSIAARKHVELRFFQDPALPGAILSDAVRLRQIIVNLVGNAIKFSAGEYKRGRVRVRFEAAGPGNMCIRVVDNGIGMSKAAMVAVFEPFSQADSSTTRRFGGTGLGLPITKRIIDLMHGKLDMESEQGAGTSFAVTLPVIAAENNVQHEHHNQLQNCRCYLLCRDISLFADWSNYLRNAGATVKQISSLTALDFAQMEKSAADENLNVLIAIDNNARIDDYQEVSEKASDKAVQKLILVRELEHQSISIENEAFTIIAVHPNLDTTFQRVVSAVQGDVAHLLDNTDASSGVEHALSREEAERTGRMILVAEDNDINQKVIRNQLDLLGYACDIAANGEEALKLLGKHQYSLLLTDLHMPIIDGYELTAAIRKQEQGLASRLPILAFTANATKSERKSCIESGMNDYLPKPVPLENLQQKLARWTRQPDVEVVSSSTTATRTETETTTILDVGVLEKLVGAEQSVIQGFLQDYKASSQKSAAEIIGAYKVCEWQKVGKLAHSLKSSSRSVGAMELAGICEGLESAGKNQDETQIHELMTGFQQSLHAVVESISKRGI